MAIVLQLLQPRFWTFCKQAIYWLVSPSCKTGSMATFAHLHPSHKFACAGYASVPNFSLIYVVAYIE